MPTENVLICAPTGRDGPLLVRCLERDGVQSVPYDSVELLAAALDQRAQAVIIAEEALVSRGVERLFEFLKNQAAWSDITVILLTHGGVSAEASQVSSELVNLFGAHGNVNMLERPIRLPTLVSAVR
ncbi:MAG TPA: hypothetical protein VIM00_09390, partial [Candidatus Acidoferrum sp.]